MSRKSQRVVKIIRKQLITDAVVAVMKKAVTDLPHDVEDALRSALQQEDNETAKLQLEAILKNQKMARESFVPMCQDTGIPIFFVGVGSGVEVDITWIGYALSKGMKDATDKIPLRPSIVNPSRK